MTMRRYRRPATLEDCDPLRILFLDFDGVLNSGPYMRTWAQAFYLTAPQEAKQSQAERFKMDAAKIDTLAIERVNRIIAATGARVVVCSSWRHFHPVSRLRRLLRSRGFVGSVVGVTPAIPGAMRGAECVAWLAAHPRAAWSFAALDDDEDYDPMINRLVRTSSANYRYDGLKEKHVAAAIKLPAVAGRCANRHLAATGQVAHEEGGLHATPSKAPIDGARPGIRGRDVRGTRVLQRRQGQGVRRAAWWRRLRCWLLGHRWHMKGLVTVSRWRLESTIVTNDWADPQPLICYWCDATDMFRPMAPISYVVHPDDAARCTCPHCPRAPW